MARLLTIIKERQILQNEFRKLLEDQFIDTAKKEEQDAKEAKEATVPKVEQPVPKRAEKKRKKPVIEGDSQELAKGTVLDEEDVELIKNSQERLTQTQLLRKYVKNWKELKPKQRRIAVAKINAIRSSQAKEIIMKELYAISKQRELFPGQKVQTTISKDSEDAIKERLGQLV